MDKSSFLVLSERLGDRNKNKGSRDEKGENEWTVYAFDSGKNDETNGYP